LQSRVKFGAGLHKSYRAAKGRFAGPKGRYLLEPGGLGNFAALEKGIKKKGAVVMKGDPKLIDVLNELLADELTAINQYIVHAEMCEDWGYGKLHEGFEKRAIDEMIHAEKLIGRILFLGGTPIVSNLKDIHIGAEIAKQVENDRIAETGAIKSYNDAIILAGELRDYATRDILMQILNDEDRHMDQLEELQDQIEQMGLPIFLTTQVD
jgi:bacterioferritin